MVRLEPCCTPEFCLLNVDMPSHGIVIVVGLGGIGKKKQSIVQCYVFQHQIAPVKHSKQAERIKQEGQFRIY